MFAANVFAQNSNVDIYKTSSEIMYVREFRDSTWFEKKFNIGEAIILVNANEISITNYTSSSVYKITNKELKKFSVLYKAIDKSNFECEIEIIKTAWILNVAYPTYYFQLELERKKQNK